MINNKLLSLQETKKTELMITADIKKQKNIITYVSDYDDISLETLVNESPFDEYEWIDVFGQDFIGVRNYILKLHEAIVVA